MAATATDSREPTAAKAARRRRPRVPGGRPNKVLVEFTDEEMLAVKANAAAARMADAAWVATAAVRVRPPGGDSVPEALRDALEVLIALRRQLAGAARNLNQLTAARHATGEDPAELPHMAKYVRDLATRIDADAARLLAEARRAL